jgi:hypothetical protein
VILYVLVMLWQAIDDAGHDRAVKLKVRGLEAVDRAIGQLARLLWEAGKAGHYQYFICNLPTERLWEPSERTT